MIRFKDKVFDEYFINENTAEITDLNGNILKTKLHQGRNTVTINGLRMNVHVIQAHTAYGYTEGYVVHHKDRNTLNDALSNLMYISHSEHSTIHGHKVSDITRKKMSIASRGNQRAKGKHWKLSQDSIRKSAESRRGSHWYTNGITQTLARECPVGYWRGMLER